MDQRASRLMESYPFRKSIKHVYRGRWNFNAFSISMKEKQVLAQPLPLQKQHWLSRRKSPVLGFTRFKMAFVKTFIASLGSSHDN